MRALHQRLLRDLLPQLAVAEPADGTAIDLAGLMTGYRRLWLEIGFGGGEHLAAQAAAHGDTLCLGVEFFLNGIASLLGHVETQRLTNVRVCDGDARRLIAGLPAQSVDRLFVLFPDPWPKRRHWPRRIVQPQALDAFARILRPGGELRLATDDPDYQVWMLRHLAARPDFVWLANGPGDFWQRPADWPPSRYEAKAIAAGRPPLFLRYRRC